MTSSLHVPSGTWGQRPGAEDPKQIVGSTSLEEEFVW